MITETAKVTSTLVREFYNQYPYPKPFIDVDEIDRLGEADTQSAIRRRVEESFSKGRRNFIAQHALEDIIDTAKGKSILDAGCGTGINTVFFAKLMPDTEIIAADITEASLFILEKTLDVCGITNVTVMKADLTGDLLALPKRFDYVFCLGVIHHTAEPALTLKNLSRVLRPDGVMTTFIYNRWGRTKEILANRFTNLLSRARPEAKKDIIEKLGLDRRLLGSNENILQTLKARSRNRIREIVPPILYKKVVSIYSRSKGGKGIKQDPASFNSNWDAFAHPSVHFLDIDGLYDMLEEANLKLKGLWFEHLRTDYRKFIAEIITEAGIGEHIDISFFGQREIYILAECLLCPRKIYFRCRL